MSAATSPTAGPSMACHASAPRGPARAGPRGAGAITLPRRRPPQGLRPPACPRRSPRGPHPHSAADARGASEGATGASVDDAWLWLFTTIEQGAVECLGHPACKRGDRFAANQPVAGALTPRFGTRGVGAARGVELRHDHDNQHRNDDLPWPEPLPRIHAGLRVRRRTRDPRRRRTFLPHAQGTIHPRPHRSQPRGTRRRRCCLHHHRPPRMASRETLLPKSPRSPPR